MGYSIRFLRTAFGLTLFGLGCYLSIQANLGLAPWDALHMGISYMTGMTYGDAGVLVGVAILVVDVALGEKLGFGTVFNTLVVSKIVDVCNYFSLMPKIQGLLPGALAMLLGQVFIAFGSYFYIGVALGGGPRDSLMVALNRRSGRIPIGAVRTCIEGAALACGWLMGAKVGIGTVIAMASIGPIVQAVFTLMRFDPKSVAHESFFVTLRGLKSAILAFCAFEKA